MPATEAEMETGTMSPAQRTGTGVSLWEATAELVSAGQDLVVARLDLLRSEISEDVNLVAVGAALVVASSLIAALGWLLLVGALTVWLTRHVELDLALLIVGLPHLVGGAILGFMAVRRFRRVHLGSTEGDAHA
jgi:hypothetical protein